MPDTKAAAELELGFAKQRTALARDIRRANRDMPRYVREHGVTFDYETKRDVLTISIGDRPQDFYTQGVGNLHLDLTIDGDQIIGFTFLHFQRDVIANEEAAKHAGQFLKDLLPLLLEYGTVSFPPERKATSKVGATLRELVPA